MLCSVSWLKKYVDIDVDTATLARDMTMLGLNVERIHSKGLTERLVVVGHVLEAEQHPNADRLRVCKVDVGTGEPLGIVCGAPNVAAGQKVPVAQIGAQLPNGLKIRKSKIRGEVSHGMICSEIELGLGDDAAGIMVLDPDVETGTVFADVLGESDEVLEIEVTPNRPDQLSHLGVAREIAALYRKPLRVPETSVPGNDDIGPCFSVEIDNPADCYRFTGRVMRGVTVGPSPQWLRAALESLGLNSINNIVDITNYVMMETGQPMHAYDLDRLPARRMGVRRARMGEKMVALDEKEYTLEPHYLMITDGDEPVGVAGVIGGNETRVTETTRNLLLESAAFDARVVRATRKSMNINTDASYRFERGSDREGCMRASDRAVELIQEIAGGEAKERIDAFPTPWPKRTVRIRAANTRRLLGISLGVEEIADLLARLHFRVMEKDGEGVTVSVPSFRADIVEEADLVEEVARLHGYDKIGRSWDFRTTTWAGPDEFTDFTEAAATHLCARGHHEVLTTSFSDGRELDLMGWNLDDPRRRQIPVTNPLTSNHSFMRTSLLPGTLDVIRRNIAHGTRHVHVFNPGAVFLPKGEAGALPVEASHLLIAKTRPENPDFWRHSKESVDLYAIKEEIEKLADALRVDLGGRLAYRFDNDRGQFQWSGRSGVVIEGGIVPAGLIDAYDIDQAVWYANVDMGALFELRASTPTFKPLPEYPISKRDLSLLVSPSVGFDQVEKSLAKSGGALLESLQVFDVYRGDNVPDGRTAFGVRLSFRSREGTLTDSEVDAVVARMIDKLQSDLGVTLRS